MGDTQIFQIVRPLGGLVMVCELRTIRGSMRTSLAGTPEDIRLIHPDPIDRYERTEARTR